MLEKYVQCIILKGFGRAVRTRLFKLINMQTGQNKQPGDRTNSLGTEQAARGQSKQPRDRTSSQGTEKRARGQNKQPGDSTSRPGIEQTARKNEQSVKRKISLGTKKAEYAARG
jgi:hypothetical protein